jgi:CARDB
MKRRILLGALSVVAVAAGFPSAGAAVGGVGVPAQIVDVTKETAVQTYQVTDYNGTADTRDDRVGTTTFRVVKDTGNCCENHLAGSKEGRLFDIGGSFINYTDDRGVTWKSVRPLNPLVNGEGSMSMAPNGDVIGMTWDAYSGDHFDAYKFNAESKSWFTLDNPLVFGFYDRPWLTVVPGPFAIGLGADTVPYISLVQGGTGLKDPMLESDDGLSYTAISSPLIDAQTDNPVTSWFPIKADPSFDWIQPIRSSPTTGLGDGYAIGVSANTSGVFLLSPDRHWDAWKLPNGQDPPTYIQIDSAGRIHNVRSSGSNLEYRISADQGRTWTSAIFPVPFGGLTDFKVNKAVGISALALRINNQDWAYKFDISGNTAKLLRRYKVGLGDVGAGSSIGALTNPRMDFQTVNIFPDGRIALSVLDSTTLSHPPGTGQLGRITPAVAIELDTSLPQADLAPTGLNLTAVKSTITFSAKATNLGQAWAGDFAVRFLVDGVPLGSDAPVASLSAGATTDAIRSSGWDAAKKDGTHTVTVVVDATNTVGESNEANNTASLTFKVKGARLVG